MVGTQDVRCSLQKAHMTVDVPLLLCGATVPSVSSGGDLTAIETTTDDACTSAFVRANADRLHRCECASSSLLDCADMKMFFVRQWTEPLRPWPTDDNNARTPLPLVPVGNFGCALRQL